MHDLDVTLWVGKEGIGPAVVDELATQLEEREVVKVKVLRSARGDRSAAAIAEELADAVDGTVVDIRGHTAVIAT